MIGASVLLDDFLINDVVYSHVATLFREEYIFPQYRKMLYSLPNIHRPWQQKALRIIPFEIVTFIIIRKELLIPKPE